MKRLPFAVIATIIMLAGSVHATPSKQIWIPSTDVQPFGVVHFGADVYSTPLKGLNNTTTDAGNTYNNADNGWNMVNYGLTVGVFPGDDEFGVEIGFDYRDISGNSKNPLFLNAKVGGKVGAFGESFPLEYAVGIYDFSPKSTNSPTDSSDLRNDSNIVYGLVAKTFGTLGRISFGVFSGNDKVLQDATGMMASWDQAIDDTWWMAVDYMGGSSIYGALSFGVSYRVSDKSSFILGTNMFNNSSRGQALTFQYDVNF